MKLVVGLGNPGEKYSRTRHNVGFLAVDEMMKEKLEGVKFLKPQEYMNRSGVVLKEYLKKNPKIKLENVYVVHDDLDIKLGEYKLVFGKGPREHKGLNNIYEQVGSKDFWHVRVGVDAPRSQGKENARMSGEEFVLSRWRPEEKEAVNQVIDKVVKELKDVLD